jgi:hypothetical protein
MMKQLFLVLSFVVTSAVAYSVPSSEHLGTTATAAASSGSVRGAAGSRHDRSLQDDGDFRQTLPLDPVTPQTLPLDPVDPQTLPLAPPSTRSALCFSAATTLDVQGRGPVPMQDLRVGDVVRTTSQKTTTWEPIYAFAHYNPQKTAKFLQVYTSDKHTLELSPKHLVFVEGKKNPVTADSLRVGDALRLAAADKTKATIRKITPFTRHDGVYAPLTPSGTLVVNANGIVASNYVSLQDGATEWVEWNQGSKESVLPPMISQHDLLHLATSPVRLWMTVWPSSVSSSQHYNDDGMLVWVAMGIALADGAQQQPMLLQVLLMVLFMMVVTPFYALELVLQSVGGSTPLAAAMTFCWLFVCLDLVMVLLSKCKEGTKSMWRMNRSQFHVSLAKVKAV